MSVPGPQAGPDAKGDVLVCLGFGGEAQLSPHPSSTLFRKPRALGPLGSSLPRSTRGCRLVHLCRPGPALLEPALS